MKKTKKKVCMLTLRSAFADRYSHWGLDRLVEMRLSPAMHDLYLEDFPRSFADPELRTRLVVVGPNDYFYKWQGNELAWLEHSPLAPFLDIVEQRYSAAARLEGKVTALALAGGNHQLLFVNRRYCQTVPTTFDELLDETWRLRNRNVLLWPFVYPTNACYFVLPLLYGFGAPLWSDPTQPDVGITRDALYKTLELHRRLMYDDIILPVKWEQYHSVFEFQTGRAAFCFGGDWDISSHQQALGEDLVIAPIPSLERVCRSTASCNYLYLSADLDPSYLESVTEVAQLLLSEEVQADMFHTLHRMPARKGLQLDPSGLDTNLRCSYETYRSAVFLPPYRILSHIYHVLADLFEPGALVRNDLEDLTERAYLKMQDVESTILIR